MRQWPWTCGMAVVACALDAVGCDNGSDVSVWSSPGVAGSAGGPTGAQAGGPAGAQAGSGGEAGYGPGTSPCGARDETIADRSTEELFAETEVPTFDLYLPEETWTSLKANARDEQFTMADACYNGKAIGQVGMRFKGSYGTLYNCFDAAGKQTCKKLSLKLKFNEYQPDLRFFGLKRINFNSAIYDASYLRERLSYDLYRAMDVVAPRASWAVVRVNGQTQGLFAMVEQVDGIFTKDRWPAGGEGNLFKEAWPKRQDAAWLVTRLETNEDTANVDGLLAFGNELVAAPAGEQRAALGRHTDLDYLARYMAVDDAIINADGITTIYTAEDASWAGNHNFYFYQEEDRDFFWMIPWDLHATFATEQSLARIPRWTEVPADCSLHYPMWTGENSVLAPGCDPFFQALAADPTAYRAAAVRLLEGPFSEATIIAQIDQHAAFIRSVATTDPYGPGAAGFEGGVQYLKSMVATLRARLELLKDGRPLTPFLVTTTAVNDFETSESLALVMSSTLMTNPASSAQRAINEQNPIDGQKDLKLAFQYRNETVAWQQWTYFSLPITPSPLDATGLTGIRLRVRADRARTLRLEVESPHQTATDLGVRFGWDVPVTAESSRATVNFADAKVPSWAVDQKKDPQDDPSLVRASITGLAFHPYCVGRNDANGQLPEGTADEGWLEVDDLEFF